MKVEIVQFQCISQHFLDTKPANGILNNEIGQQRKLQQPNNCNNYCDWLEVCSLIDDV